MVIIRTGQVHGLVLYIPNFLDFPVGIVVPVGFYDRGKAQWVPGDSGRVVQVVSVANGVAEIDTDGDGTADNDPALSSRWQSATRWLACMHRAKACGGCESAISRPSTPPGGPCSLQVHSPGRRKSCR